MSKSFKGSCLCGAVSYQFHGPEYVFQYCHCSRCRKFTGSAHATNIIVAPDQFEWLSGADKVGRFEHPEAVVIPAGTLDEDPEIRPSQNIFWKDRVAWREAVESLPHYDELQPRKARD